MRGSGLSRHPPRRTACRAEVVGVEMDHEGILPEALEAACRRHGAQVLVLTPDAQNPTAASMGARRRAEVIPLARAYDLQVIEDHCYAPSQCDQPALRMMAPERCWYVGSLSKSISAALRFGYIVCPRGMGEAEAVDRATRLFRAWRAGPRPRSRNCCAAAPRPRCATPC